MEERKNFKKYHSFEEKDLYSPDCGDLEKNIIDFLQKIFENFKDKFDDLNFVRIKCILETEPDFATLYNEFLSVIQEFLGIDQYSFMYQNKNEVEWKTNTGVDTLDNSQLIVDIGNLDSQLDLGEMTHLQKLDGSFPSLEPILNKFPDTYIVKVERMRDFLPVNTYTMVHLNSESNLRSKFVLEQSHLFTSLEELIVKLTDLMLRNSFADLDETNLMFLEQMKDLTSEISSNIELLFLPYLIMAIEDNTKQKCRFVVDTSEYLNKNDNIIYLGFTKGLNYIPIIINQDSKYTSLNFTLTQLWMKFRYFNINRVNFLTNCDIYESLNTQPIQNFDRNMVQSHTNCNISDVLSDLFRIPEKINQKEDLYFNNQFVHDKDREGFERILKEMLENGSTQYNTKLWSIRVKWNWRNIFRGITIVFHREIKGHTHDDLEDLANDFSYVMKPMRKETLLAKFIVDKFADTPTKRDDKKEPLTENSNQDNKFNINTKAVPQGRRSSKKLSNFSKNTSDFSQLNIAKPPRNQRSLRKKVHTQIHKTSEIFPERMAKTNSHCSNKSIGNVPSEFLCAINDLNSQLEQTLDENKLRNTIVMQAFDLRNTNNSSTIHHDSHNQNSQSTNHRASRWKRDAIMDKKIEEKKQKLTNKLDFDNHQPTSDDILKANLIKHSYKDWNVDILVLNEIQLIGFVREIFSANGWISKYSIKDSTFVKFMWKCNYYYSRKQNPFHNFHHGVSVGHAANWFLQNSPKISNQLNDDEKFAYVVAALGHDLDHRGKSNTFEINSTSKLAQRYNDKSPLENHHCSMLFRILEMPERNIMANVDNMNTIRKQMIENIQSTDMVHHFHKLADFKKKLMDNPNYGTDPNNAQEKIEITNIFVHTSDQCGSAKTRKVASKWTERVNKEFAAQYLEEQENEYPLTPFFANQDNPIVFHKSEFSFQTFIVTPLYQITNMYDEGKFQVIQDCLEESTRHHSDRHKELSGDEQSQFDKQRQNSGQIQKRLITSNQHVKSYNK